MLQTFMVGSIAGAAHAGYESVCQIDGAAGPTRDACDEADTFGLTGRSAPRRRSDMKRGIVAMTMVVAFLWISVMPMQKSQEKALRGLICLALVVFAALLVGWAVKKTAADVRAQAENDQL